MIARLWLRVKVRSDRRRAEGTEKSLNQSVDNELKLKIKLKMEMKKKMKMKMKIKMKMKTAIFFLRIK